MMNYSQEEIQDAVKKKFSDRYVIIQPRSREGNPDAMTVTLDGDFEIDGFEIKRTRQDWLAERRSPYKNRTFIELCDRWHIVALEGVVKLEDLPEDYGYYLVKDGPELILQKPPKKLNPVPVISRSLAHLIFRHVANDILETEQTKRSYWNGYKDAVEKLLGVDFYGAGSIDGKQLAALMQALEDRVHFRLTEHLNELRSTAAGILERIDETLSKLPVFEDWQTGKDLPPRAEVHREKVEQKLKSEPFFAKMAETDKNEFDRVVKHYLTMLYQGHPVLGLQL